MRQELINLAESERQGKVVKTINTFSDLRNYEPTVDKESILVLGGASLGDLNAGSFRYDQADGSTADDNLNTIVTVGGARWKRVRLNYASPSQGAKADSALQSGDNISELVNDHGYLDSSNIGTGLTQIRNNQQNALTFSPILLQTITEAGVTRTITGTDSGKKIKFTALADVVVTLPEDLTEAISNGFQCVIEYDGDGTLTVQTEGTDVLRSANSIYTITSKYGAVAINKDASGVWWMTGATEPWIDLTGFETYDLVQWDGTKIVKGVDTLRGGSVDYADLATQTTPLSYTGGSGWVNLPNDGAGPLTNTGNLPQGITGIYDTVLDEFDFTELTVGTQLIMRITLEVTTSGANQDFSVRLSAGEGGPTPFQINLGEEYFRSAGANPISLTLPFDIGNTNTRDWPAHLQISSPNNLTIKVGGWRTQIYIKG